MKWVDLSGTVKGNHGVDRIQVNWIKQQITEHGYIVDPLDPVKVFLSDEGIVFVRTGNHRVQAVLELGYTEIPAYVR
jgi:ParB-like chromosome segregation protein Spo0J